jgi:uncharacterized membrane protein (DUF106 family)
MNERMTQAQEELQEFQNEFELLAGDKSERYRELKTREQHMDTFLASQSKHIFKQYFPLPFTLSRTDLTRPRGKLRAESALSRTRLCVNCS